MPAGSFLRAFLLAGIAAGLLPASVRAAEPGPDRFAERSRMVEVIESNAASTSGARAGPHRPARAGRTGPRGLHDRDHPGTGRNGFRKAGSPGIRQRQDADGRRRFAMVFAAGATLFGVSALAGFAIAQELPFALYLAVAVASPDPMPDGTKDWGLRKAPLASHAGDA